MQNSLSIIGAGAWGSALSIALSNNFNTIYLHTRNKKNIHTRVHQALTTKYPANVKLTLDLSIITKSKNVLIAVPSCSFFQVLTNIKPYLTKNHHIAWATKGFDTHNKCFLHETFERILKKHHSCVISGPSFAFEVANNKPTALVVASKNKATSKYWRDNVHTSTIRAYTNIDIKGVEIGGAVKNILAIAAGIAAGLNFGANAQAALITRGLSEMTKLGKKLGANESTFNGLSGLGDLVLTCADDLSRNRQFGKELANNQNTEQALYNVGATVEGVNALEFILYIAKKNKIELPICKQVQKVIKGMVTPIQAVIHLMSREQIDE